MPLLYGEGQERAFVRLQEEIIKHNDDYTIFLWRGVEDGHPGLLARDPAGFADMGDAYSSQSDEDQTQPVRREDPAPLYR